MLIRIRFLIRMRAVAIVAAVILATLGSAVANPKPARAAGPSFVQTQAREIASGKTDGVTFASANAAGNLIVASVFWNNTGAVTLADSRGNAYTSVAARRTWGSNWSEQTFFAKNVARRRQHGHSDIRHDDQWLGDRLHPRIRRDRQGQSA